MNAKEAVSAAKFFIQDMFADEQIEDLGLEEVEYEEIANFWYVTVGFSRPWDKNALTDMQRTGLRRSYKVVTISDNTGEVISVKNWNVPVAA